MVAQAVDSEQATGLIRRIEQVPISRIRLVYGEDNLPLNPRGTVWHTDDLKASLDEFGQTDPIQLIPDGDKFLVVDGHRRLTAARALGWKTVLAEILEQVSDDDLFARMVASNVREDLSPLAKGRAFEKLVKRGWPLERAARLAGENPDKAQVYLDLISAPVTLQQRVESGEMSISAWVKLRDRPVEVQVAAAALEHPTKRAVQKLAKEKRAEAKGIVSASLAEGTSGTLQAVQDVRKRLTGEVSRLTDGEKAQVITILAELLELCKA